MNINEDWRPRIGKDGDTNGALTLLLGLELGELLLRLLTGNLEVDVTFKHTRIGYPLRQHATRRRWKESWRARGGVSSNGGEDVLLDGRLIRHGQRGRVQLIMKSD